MGFPVLGAQSKDLFAIKPIGNAEQTGRKQFGYLDLVPIRQVRYWAGNQKTTHWNHLSVFNINQVYGINEIHPPRRCEHWV